MASSEIPTRDGYTFAYWVHDGNIMCSPSGLLDGYNRNLHMIAVWNKNKLIDVVTASNYGEKVVYSAGGINDWRLVCVGATSVVLMSNTQIDPTTLRHIT